DNFTAENTHMPGSIGLRLDPNAIGDPQPTGLNSINDILTVVLASPTLTGLIDSGLIAANPLSNGGCGILACSPRVRYNAGPISYDTPSSALVRVPGGREAQVTLPNMRLTVTACGTTCCMGGSTIPVRATSITATVAFSLQLSGGVLGAGLQAAPAVSVNGV